MRGRKLATVGVAAALGWGLVGVPPAAADHLPYHDPALPVATRVADLLSRMSLDDKLGQMTQAERGAVSPSDITTYRLGSVLSGGGSARWTTRPRCWLPPSTTSATALVGAGVRVPGRAAGDARLVGHLVAVRSRGHRRERPLERDPGAGGLGRHRVQRQPRRQQPAAHHLPPQRPALHDRLTPPAGEPGARSVALPAAPGAAVGACFPPTGWGRGRWDRAGGGAGSAPGGGERAAGPDRRRPAADPAEPAGPGRRPGGQHRRAGRRGVAGGRAG